MVHCEIYFFLAGTELLYFTVAMRVMDIQIYAISICVEERYQQDVMSTCDMHDLRLHV